MGICRWLRQIAQRRTEDIENRTLQKQDICLLEKPAHPNSTVKCSCCGGVGTVWRGSLAESPLPSRAGYFEEFPRATPYQPCPVCRGSGVVSAETSR